MLAALGRRPGKAKLRPLLMRLMELRAWKPADLARTVGFAGASKLVERYLAPMVNEGLLERSHPDNPTHPDQAYRARQGSLPAEPRD
jgi:ATP-dependent DNA helicase RecG